MKSDDSVDAATIKQVTLCVRVWIEMLTVTIDGSAKSCHPLREGVD